MIHDDVALVLDLETFNAYMHQVMEMERDKRWPRRFVFGLARECMSNRGVGGSSTSRILGH